MRLILRFEEAGVAFTVVGGDVPALPVSGWPAQIHRDLEDRRQWSALATAWSDARITEKSLGRYQLPYGAYSQLGEETVDRLKLPKVEPVQITLLTKGAVTQALFRIEAEVEDRHGTSLAGVPRVECLYLRTREEAYAVSDSVRKLLDLVEQLPPDGADNADRMQYVAQVKAAAAMTDGQAILDPYLRDNDYESATLGVRVTGANADRVTLRATVEKPHDDDPVDVPEDGRVVTVRPSSNTRRRVILSEDDRTTATEIQQTTIKGSDVPKFVTNPQAYLPDAVSIDDYSDRVKSIGIQVYNSRPYLHVKENEQTGGLEGALKIKIDNLLDEDDDRAEAQHERPLTGEKYRELVRKSDDEGWVKDGDRWLHVETESDAFVKKIEDEIDTSDTGYQPIPQAVLQIFRNLGLEDQYRGYFHVDPTVDPARIRQEFPGWSERPLSNRFDGDLRAYQTETYRQLTDLFETKRGLLLADEMGLGKTVQVLAHIAWLLESGAPERQILIVIPLTLFENWRREIQKFVTPTPSIHSHEGLKQHRFTGLRGAQIVLVSYDTLRRDQLALAQIDWSLVICDEAQNVKNPTAQRTSVVKALKADQRIALTGTPVENGLSEFWCIMDFVAPGVLGTWKEFRTVYERPIVADEPDRDELIQRLKEQCGPHLVRRDKAILGDDLPALAAPNRIEVPLSDEQLHRYRDVLRESRDNGTGVLGALYGLRMCCALPPNDAASVDDQRRECPKLDATLTALHEIQARGEKVLIFTTFLKVQALLQQAIGETFGIFVDCINGAVTDNRQLIVDRFQEQEGFGVLVLSHQVAGVGLNVTAATHVVHYTRPWNPAQESQATSRAHRYGQTQTVQVHLPIVTHERFKTIEQAVDDLLVAKQRLASDVLVPMGEIRDRDVADAIDQEPPPDLLAV